MLTYFFRFAFLCVALVRVWPLNRGQLALATWNDASYAYSIMQLYMGSNFMANLQVVSTLNTLNFISSLIMSNIIFNLVLA